uniref:F-box and WD repeat domain containing 8 n=1 Tax=Stegastes partitus TaxID=144197 RepID=A0A3B5A7N6_9TELE
MAENELAAFRERWKKELTCKKEDKPPLVGDSASSWDLPGQSGRKNLKRNNKACSSSISEEGVCAEDEACVGGGAGQAAAAQTDEDQPQYVSIARGLLDGRTSPLLDRIQEERTRRKRHYQSMTDVCSASLQQQQRPQRKVKKEELVDQLIQDLNEVNDIPFFDIELPYELALKIFQYLNCTELGRCAQSQVSRAWRVLAEDSVLWFKMCTGEGYHQDASVSDSPCWKSTLRDCRNSAKTVSSNWKNRVGSISQLQFELGKVLCDVSSCDNFVLAYTSGDVRLWDTLHWDSAASYLKANSLSVNTDPRPHVSHVQVNGALAAAAYEDCVDLWSTETGGEPIHHYQSPGRIQALALSPDSPVLLSASGSDVRLDRASDCGYWRTACQAHLPKAQVDSVAVVPGREQQWPLAALAAGETVYLLDPREEKPRTLHSVYGHPVTCLDASDSQVAFGVKRSGWAMHDGGNKIHVYSLETSKPTVCVGNSPGDFTCINLRDSPPHLLVCGNKDRVRVFDLRAGSSVASLYAHHLGVTSVQADDWKIVSGGGEGLVCVWEMRMGAKLWEMHNHPVRHVRFNTSTLVTANIPDDKSPRGACITDDDLTAHRRHRGVICHYDFSEDSLSQDHILPICRSDYTESHGYNYNISLAVPYD